MTEQKNEGHFPFQQSSQLRQLQQALQQAQNTIKPDGYSRPQPLTHNPNTRADRIKHLIHTSSTGISVQALHELERNLNTIWTEHDIYLVVTGTHFLEQITRSEHSANPISLLDISRILRDFTTKYLRTLIVLPFHDENYGVIKDMKTHINVGFVLRPGVGISGYSRDLMLQTILRKSDFITRDRTYQL